VRELALAAEAYGHEPGRLVARVNDFDRAARWRRSARVSVPLMLGALLSVPIPGWHFAGVPGFLVAAFVFGRRRLNQPYEVTSLEGACPACSNPQSFEPPAGFPVRLPCPGCGEFLKIDEC